MDTYISNSTRDTQESHHGRGMDRSGRTHREGDAACDCLRRHLEDVHGAVREQEDAFLLLIAPIDLEHRVAKQDRVLTGLIPTIIKYCYI